jgi:hypothetical protein
MNRLTYRESNKLHYGKYLYKLKTKNTLASIFRSEKQRSGKLSFAAKRIKELKDSMKNSQTYSVVVVTKFRKSDVASASELSDAETIYKILKNSEDYSIRCEDKSLAIYTNSLEILEKIGTSITTKTEIWKPLETALDILEKGIIVVKSKPEYPLKVTFGPKKGSKSLAEWVDKNSSLVKIGRITLQRHREERSWIQGNYMYVKNEQVLTLIKMIVGDNILKIEKLLYKENIDK